MHVSSVSRTPVYTLSLSFRTRMILMFGYRFSGMELIETLRTFLENGEDWERKMTSIRGVTLLKLPQTKSRSASLAIEINPLTEKGTPMKKKGVMIMGASELDAFREIFNNEKMDILITSIEAIAPSRKAAKGGKEDILQV